MNQIDFAVHQTAHGDSRGYLKEMAEFLGMGEQVLRNKVNPDQEAKLSLNEAVRMMRKDGDLRILQAIAAEFGFSLCHAAAPSKSLMKAMLNANAEHGDVTRAVADALDGARLTPARLAEIRKEIAEDRQALDELEQTIIAEAGEM